MPKENKTVRPIVLHELNQRSVESFIVGILAQATQAINTIDNAFFETPGEHLNPQPNDPAQLRLLKIIWKHYHDAVARNDERSAAKFLELISSIYNSISKQRTDVINAALKLHSNFTNLQCNADRVRVAVSLRAPELADPAFIEHLIETTSNELGVTFNKPPPQAPIHGNSKPKPPQTG